MMRLIIWISMALLLQAYRFIFCRSFFYALNLHLFKLSLRGIGVLNSEGPEITGETWFLKKLSTVKGIRTIVDVGANNDAYGASNIPTAHVYACEPHPHTVELLRQAVKTKKQKNVTILQLAISNHTGNLELWDFAADAQNKSTQPTSTLASLNRSVIEQLHGQKAAAIPVKCQTLDNLAKKYDWKRIDVLKIDTEGYELQVLQGALQLLDQRKIKIVQFEFNEMNSYTGSRMKDFYDILPDHQFYRLMPHGLFPLGPYRPLTHELTGFQNVVALPKWDTSILSSLGVLK